MREVLVAHQPVAAPLELGPEEWVRRFEAWTRSHEGMNLPALSDEAMNRESIYADRGL